ncbi:MAG: sodium/proton-translocating pyrophosphatase, partial [Anaerolineales bacterium]
MMEGLNTFEQVAIWSVLGVAILGLAYAWFLRSQILREDKGSARMQEVWGWIRDGADAYLQRQLKSILPLIALLTVALFLSVYIVPPSLEAKSWHCATFQGQRGLEAMDACAQAMTEGSAAYQQVQWLIGLARAI